MPYCGIVVASFVGAHVMSILSLIKLFLMITVQMGGCLIQQHAPVFVDIKRATTKFYYNTFVTL